MDEIKPGKNIPLNSIWFMISWSLMILCSCEVWLPFTFINWNYMSMKGNANCALAFWSFKCDKASTEIIEPILWIYSFRMSLSPCLKKWGIRKPHTCSGGTRIFLWGGGHRGGKMRFWGSKNQKICQKWLILAIFPFWLGGHVGAEPPMGGGANAPHGPPWCHHCIPGKFCFTK